MIFEYAHKNHIGKWPCKDVTPSGSSGESEAGDTDAAETGDEDEQGSIAVGDSSAEEEEDEVVVDSDEQERGNGDGVVEVKGGVSSEEEEIGMYADAQEGRAEEEGDGNVSSSQLQAIPPFIIDPAMVVSIAESIAKCRLDEVHCMPSATNEPLIENAATGHQGDSDYDGDTCSSSDYASDSSNSSSDEDSSSSSSDDSDVGEAVHARTVTNLTLDPRGARFPRVYHHYRCDFNAAYGMSVSERGGPCTCSRFVAGHPKYDYRRRDSETSDDSDDDKPLKVKIDRNALNF